jgi:cell wall-associated NlpC family hydrolase
MQRTTTIVNQLLGEGDVKADLSPMTRRLTGANQGASLAPEPGGKGKRGAIINEAEKYLGQPYHWGGASPGTSFDCSGLVQWAYKRVGIKLPRVSADQARYGTRVPTNQLKRGDLVAWDNSSRNSGADHIAIYIGNGKIIEAAHTGTNIRVRALGSNEGAWGVKVMK